MERACQQNFVWIVIQISWLPLYSIQITLYSTQIPFCEYIRSMNTFSNDATHILGIMVFDLLTLCVRAFVLMTETLNSEILSTNNSDELEILC